MILRNRTLGATMNHKGKKETESVAQSTNIDMSTKMELSCDKHGKESSCDLVLRDSCVDSENDGSLDLLKLSSAQDVNDSCEEKPVQNPNKIIDLVCSPCSTEDVVLIYDEFDPDIEVVNSFGLSTRKGELQTASPQHDGANIIRRKRKGNVLNNSITNKCFNDSIEIVCEINNADSVPLKRKRNNVLDRIIKTDSHLKNQDSNNSIINLCNDDDVIIVDLHSKSFTESKKPSTGTSDIVRLDTKHHIQSSVTNSNETCLVTKSLQKRNMIEPFCDNSVVAFDPYRFGPQVSPSYSYVMPFYYMDTKGDAKNYRQNSRCHKLDTSSSHNGLPVQMSPLNSAYGNNIYNPNPKNVQTGLRPIVIDGSNVAFSHSGGQKLFSCRGLDICVKYFSKRGHKVVAFVPQFRRSFSQVQDRSILDKLEKAGQVVFTPSRRVEGQLQVPYDDRYIVQYAAEMGGVIVSTDNFRDLLKENESWRETIQNRLLMFTWVGDMLMFPQDPLGRYGPKLEEFLRFPS